MRGAGPRPVGFWARWSRPHRQPGIARQAPVGPAWLRARLRPGLPAARWGALKSPGSVSAVEPGFHCRRPEAHEDDAAHAHLESLLLVLFSDCSSSHFSIVKRFDSEIHPACALCKLHLIWRRSSSYLFILGVCDGLSWRKGRKGFVEAADCFEPVLMSTHWFSLILSLLQRCKMSLNTSSIFVLFFFKGL